MREKEKVQCVFPASVILNITNKSHHHFSVIFLMMHIFFYGHWFLVSIFTSWHLRRIRSTRIIWHIAGKAYRWLNFIWSKIWRTASTIQVSLLKYSVMFLLSYVMIIKFWYNVRCHRLKECALLEYIEHRAELKLSHQSTVKASLFVK